MFRILFYYLIFVNQLFTRKCKQNANLSFAISLGSCINRGPDRAIEKNVFQEAQWAKSGLLGVFVYIYHETDEADGGLWRQTPFISLCANWVHIVCIQPNELHDASYIIHAIMQKADVK